MCGAWAIRNTVTQLSYARRNLSTHHDYFLTLFATITPYAQVKLQCRQTNQTWSSEIQTYQIFTIN